MPFVQILPQVVEWTTYGLCSLLRRIWNQAAKDREREGPVAHYWVELTSALERSLNYAHTGNAKVLTKGVMDPLWLSLSSVLDGMPSISPIVTFDHKMKPIIHRSAWPTSTRGTPQMASKRSISLNFGRDALAVSVDGLLKFFRLPDIVPPGL